MLQRGCTAYSPLQTFARKEEWNGDSNNRSTTLQPDNVTIIRGSPSFIESWCWPTGSCRVCECIVSFRQSCVIKKLCFRPGAIRLALCGIGDRKGSFQGFPVVPRHPLRGLRLHFLSMALQLDQVVEGVGVAQLTSVNQTHEQIAHIRPIQRPIKQGILPVKNGPLQRPFANVVI